MSEWRRVPIGSVAVVRSGFAFKSKDWQAAGVPVVKIQNVRSGRVDLGRDCSFVSESVATTASRYELVPGDVLITMSGEIGSVGVFKGGGRALLNQRVGRVEPLDGTKIDQQFLAFALQHPRVKAEFEAAAYGVAQANISPSLIAQVEINVPGIVDQRKIVAILFAMEELIENNRRRIALLEQMAQAIYREWFVHFRYPGHERVELVDSPIGPIPPRWNVSDLGSEVLNFDRQREPLSRRERSERPGTFPYYGAARLIDWIDGYLFDGDYLLVAEDGSVVTSEGFPILQRVRGQFWVNNHAHVLQGAGRVTTSFLELALERYPITGHITGAAQPKITQANLNRITMLVPSPAVMRAFSDVVDPLVDERFVLDAACGVLERTRDLLLPNLLTGAIAVSDLSLHDLLDQTPA